MKVFVLLLTIFVVSSVASSLNHKDSPSKQKEEISDTGVEMSYEQEDPGISGPSFYMSHRGNCKTPSPGECKKYAATGKGPKVYNGKVLSSRRFVRPLGCYYDKYRGYAYNVKSHSGWGRGCNVDYRCVCKGDSSSKKKDEISGTSNEMAFEQEDPVKNDSPSMEEEEIIDSSDEMAFEQEDPGNNAPTKTEGGNANGANCVFPFVYNGKTYTSCTTENNDDKLWCATTDDYRNDGKWGNCVGKGPSFYMSDRGDCKTPSKRECKNIAATGQAPNVYKGEVLTTSKTQHRPLGCYYHKDRGYYYNVRNAPGVTRGCRVDYRCVCKS